MRLDDLDPRLKPASEAILEGRLDDAFRAVEGFLASPEPALLRQARELAGIVHYRAGRLKPAESLFALLAPEGGPEEWYNLACCRALLGELEEAETAMTEAGERYAAAGEDYSGPTGSAMMYFYARCLIQAGAPKQAWSYIERLGRIYTDIKVTDGSFLGLRRIPAFEDFVEAALDALKGLPDGPEPRAWLDGLRKGVDDDGGRAIDEALARRSGKS